MTTPQKEWLNVSELASMAEAENIYGVPHTRRGMQYFLSKHGIVDDPNLCRLTSKGRAQRVFHRSVLDHVIRGPVPSFLPKQQPSREKSAAPALAGTDLSTVRNSALLAELLTRIFRALGNDDGRSA